MKSLVEARIPGDLIVGPGDQSLRRAYRAGKLVRLGPGVYIDAKTWVELPHHQRFLRLVAAKTLRAPDTVYCGETALRLAGLPTLGVPQHIEVATAQPIRLGVEDPTCRAEASAPPWVHREIMDVPRVKRHHHPFETPVRVGDFWCVPLHEAAGETMSTARLGHGLTAIDGMLRHGPAMGISAEHVEGWLGDQAVKCRRVKGLQVLALGRPGAESPLESGSRAVMYQHGFEEPVLQQRHTDAQGLIGFSDFWWAEQRILAEADGAAKYLDAEMKDGRESWHVIRDEKRREARLAAVSSRVLRWMWEDMAHPHRLVQQLSAAGLRSDPRRRIRLL